MIARHTTPDNYNQRSYSLVNMQREKDAYITSALVTQKERPHRLMRWLSDKHTFP